MINGINIDPVCLANLIYEDNYLLDDTRTDKFCLGIATAKYKSIRY